MKRMWRRLMTSMGLLALMMCAANTALADNPPTDVSAGPAPRFSEQVTCRGTRYVVLLVDADIRAGIQTKLTRFEHDLCQQGYAVLTATLDPVATPYHIRQYLYGKSASLLLAGVILIGDVPHAYQWIDEPGIDEQYEAISLQYYADLDGKFLISPDYSSPGGHAYSFDIHAGSTDWEIWVGVMPPYMGDDQLTIQAINRYLDKNHAYRVNGTALPRAYMEINEHASSASPEQDADILMGMTEGDYAWSPMTQSDDAHIYFNSFDPDLSVPMGIYQMTTVGIADFTVYSAHGWYYANGLHTRQFIENNPTRTIFYWAGGCTVGDIDHADNWIASAIYAQQSQMLLVQGTTQNSGGLGTNVNGFYGANIAQAMTNGAGSGDAVKSHVNVPLAWPWSTTPELHRALVVLAGDPTLTIQIGHPNDG